MSIPAICIVGWANSGKTTLIEGLLRQLTAQGMRVGVIKHTHHPLPEDEAGKDTARFQAAGAATVTLANSEGALTREAGDKRLTELLSRVRDVDLILIEGFEKQACLPMIEVWRDPALPMRSPAQWRRAVVTASPCPGDLPVFAPGDIEAVAAFVLNLTAGQRGFAGAQAHIYLDGQELSIVPFVQRMVAGVNRGLLSTLDGYHEGCEITIRIGGENKQ